MKSKHIPSPMILLIVTLVLWFSTITSTPTVSAMANGNDDKIENLFSIDNFFDQTRLIMLKDERKIFKNLTDDTTKKIFIEEFWQKRDPSPGTDENENRFEFEQRIAYANKYFRERTGAHKGWDTDRGRVYLLLGGPDERYPQSSVLADSMGHPRNMSTEVWVYNYYRISLQFVDENGMGVYRLRYWPAQLQTAFESARFEIHQKSWQDKNNKKKFQFKTNVSKNEMKFSIPVDSLSFEETDNQMVARLNIIVFVYKDLKKHDKFVVTRDINDTKENLVNKKDLEISIPYTPTSPGKYLLDIIVEDLSSGARFRDLISYKYK